MCTQTNNLRKMLPSMQEKDGSESLPIDLSEEEQLTVIYEHNECASGQVAQKLAHRVNTLENCLEKKVNEHGVFRKKKLKNVHSISYDKLEEKIDSLDRRVGRIEHFLDQFRAVLSESFSGSCSHRDTGMEDSSSRMSETDDVEDVIATTNCDMSEVPFPGNPVMALNRDSDKDDHIVLAVDRDSGKDDHRLSENAITIVSFEKNNCEEEDRLQGLTVSETVDEIMEEDRMSQLSCDTKLALLPKLPSVKEEVPLLRDDAGRILVFLCSATKKLRSNTVVGVAGTYLQEQLHNEYVFTKDDSPKNVKFEAEIKSALFALELINTLYPGSKDTMCIMFISTCPDLVKIMKKKLYNEPSETMLQQLLFSMRIVQTHWCVAANISPDEKDILDKYQKIVDLKLAETYKTLMST